jgi:hypothetical protein
MKIFTKISLITLFIFIIAMSVDIATANIVGAVDISYPIKYKAKGVPLAAGETCRSSKVVTKFNKINNNGKSKIGYTVDHICALECGGIDSVVNMQYQTTQEAYLKDRWERTPPGCKQTCNDTNSTKKRLVFNCK